MKQHKQQLLTIIESAVGNLQQNENVINELNVFPVPDGDTGSNMLATLLAAWNNIDQKATTDVEILNSFARGALLGARGNSGVITSQIIKGFAVGVEEAGTLTSDVNKLRQIFRRVKEYAYKAVPKPVEGTILSVVKALDEKYDRSVSSLTEAWGAIHHVSVEAMKNTPNQLPILKEAGVVDSGAFGLVILIEGIIAALKGNPFIIKTTSQGTQSPESSKFIKADANKNIGYCSEFIMTLKDPHKFDDNKFKHWLDSVGDSVVYIREEDILKVHVHIKEPGDLLNKAQEYGQFSKIKIENMTTQVTEGGHEIEGDKIHTHKKVDPTKLGVIVVSNGQGLDEFFIQLGADEIVSGGQTMNPSIEDFVSLINKMPNKEILVLPNNSNIVLTAQHAAKLVGDKKIHVLETKSLQQGMMALMSINKEMTNFENFIDDVSNEFKSINEGVVTNASRDTVMNGVKVTKGHYIALSGKKILISSEDIMNVIKHVIDENIKSNSEIATIIFNDEINSDLQEEIKSYISKHHSKVDLDIRYGGQDVYQILLFAK